MNLTDKIFKKLSQNNSKPTSELYYTNIFTLLIAVILSARNTDKKVNQITKNLFHIIKTPQDILTLGEDKLKNHIKAIGLYHNKAKYIIELSKIIIQKYNGKIPTTRKDLESLPGVGRKTANVILNIAFKKDTIAVDTHVFRVAHRIGLSKGKTPLSVEYDLQKQIKKKWKLHAHNWFVLHGRYICKARNPLCEICIIQQYCEFYKKIKSVNQSLN